MKRVLAALVALVAGAGVVALIAWQGNAQSGEPPVLVAKADGTTVKTPLGELPHVTLAMDIYPQSGQDVPGPTEGVNAEYANLGWPFYWPSTTLQVPANSVVTVTLRQYDSGGPIYNDFFAKAHGTLDGTITVDGKQVKEIDPSNVAHTFTIHNYPSADQPTLNVSVPLPAVSANAKNEANGYPKPHEVTFTFVVGEKGTYVWNCEFPCGSGYVEFGGPMSQRGWMSGTLEVV